MQPRGIGALVAAALGGLISEPIREVAHEVAAKQPRSYRHHANGHTTGTLKSHDRHHELARAIDRYGDRLTKKARRRLKIAARRASVSPIA